MFFKLYAKRDILEFFFKEMEMKFFDSENFLERKLIFEFTSFYFVHICNNMNYRFPFHFLVVQLIHISFINKK